MNRFLYAQGNPASLVDPTGHDACTGAECDNPTYDNGTEGLDLCDSKCEEAASEVGPGDATYNPVITPTSPTNTTAPAITWDLYPLITPGAVAPTVASCEAQGWPNTFPCRQVARDTNGGACVGSHDPDCARNTALRPSRDAIADAFVRGFLDNLPTGVVLGVPASLVCAAGGCVIVAVIAIGGGAYTLYQTKLACDTGPEACAYAMGGITGATVGGAVGVGLGAGAVGGLNGLRAPKAAEPVVAPGTGGVAPVQSLASRMDVFRAWQRDGIRVGDRTFTINQHFINSLIKSGRRQIMPEDLVRALGQRPSPGEPGSVVYTDPVTGTRFFVNEQGTIVGVYPEGFK